MASHRSLRSRTAAAVLLRFFPVLFELLLTCLRLLRSEAAGVVPWAWAINGWMSVMASLLTIVVSRMHGYGNAFGVALGAYGLALLLSGRIRDIQER